MANITGQHTINSVLHLEVDADPSAGAGTTAPRGSLANWDDGVRGNVFYKYNVADTAWIEFEDKLMPSKQIRLYEDWLSGTITGNLGWTSTVSAGGANTIVTTNQDASHHGILQIVGGNAGGGRSTIALGVSSFAGGSGEVLFETLVRLSALSSATNGATIRIGMGDQTGGADFTNGIYFEYVFGTSTFWALKTANTGTRTSTVSSLNAVNATAWMKLAFIVKADNSQVDFYVNDTLVGSNSTNIPSASGFFSPNFSSVRIAGTAPSLFVDYMSLRILLGTAR